LIHFAAPQWLWLLLTIPLLPIARGRRGKAGALLFSSLSVAKTVAGVARARWGGWQTALRMLTVALLIVAAARPQWVRGTTDIEASGIDILLAVDVSGSMQAMDFKVDNQPTDRLEVVKGVVSRFVAQRPNDRIGLIAFAGRPYLASPLTLDHDWLQKRLTALRTGMMEDGTAIGSAIGAGVNRLRAQEAKSKIVILLTDGMNNAGKLAPLTAAEAAQALKIKVYTIGAGTRGQAPMPVTDQYGQRRMVMAQVDIDEDSLKQVAKMTGGQYFRATDTRSLEQIYAEINQMETTTQKIKKYQFVAERFHWPAIAALALLMLEIVLAQTVLRRLP